MTTDTTHTDNMRPLRITENRRRILRALLDAEDPVCPLDFAYEIGIAYGTVYSFIQQLAGRGWLDVLTEPAGSHPGRPSYRFRRLNPEGRRRAAALLKESELPRQPLPDTKRDIPDT